MPSTAESGSVPFWWIVLFLILALDSGAAVVFSIGGPLISEAVALPLFF